MSANGQSRRPAVSLLTSRRSECVSRPARLSESNPSDGIHVRGGVSDNPTLVTLNVALVSRHAWQDLTFLEDDLGVTGAVSDRGGAACHGRYTLVSR